MIKQVPPITEWNGKSFVLMFNQQNKTFELALNNFNFLFSSCVLCSLLFSKIEPKKSLSQDGSNKWESPKYKVPMVSVPSFISSFVSLSKFLRILLWSEYASLIRYIDNLFVGISSIVETILFFF